jgi:putative hydrolase, CocE/NonD family
MKIPARDGVLLECDIFRPSKPGKYPVIMSLAPYVRNGGGMSMMGLVDRGGVGSSLELFEQPNPEFWVPRGYVFITVNPRGFGGSGGKDAAGKLSEHEDYYDSIEWAAAQSWSTGKVGIAGISYYALSQYGAAALQPPHLAAMVPWEGLADSYRDIAYRGGMLSNFGKMFMGMTDMLRNKPTIGQSYSSIINHKLYDGAWKEREVDLSKITVPMLSVGGLSDIDLHLRGNVEAFMAANSKNKKLHLYAGTHWGSAYQPWANREVLRFFDQYLKGIDTGLTNEPAVKVDLRTSASTFTEIYGDSWPLPQTKWVNLNMDAKSNALTFREVGEESSARTEKGTVGGTSYRVAFRTEPLSEDLAIAGPLSSHLWISSTTKDADICIEINDIDEKGNATLFPYYYHDSDDEPVARGWLRASHRALDQEKTLPYRPYQTHEKNDWLTPGQPVPLDIEIWPTSFLFKKGHKIEVVVHTGDYKRRGERGQLAGQDADKKRSDVYDYTSEGSGRVTIYTGGAHASWILIPAISTSSLAEHPIVISDGKFAPESVTGQVGESFSFANNDTEYRTSTEQSGLKIWDSQLIRGTKSHNPETWAIFCPWAGTYHYRDEVGGGKGTIEVSPKVSSSRKGTIHVTVGLKPLPDNISFDVEIRRGDGNWTTVAKELVKPEFEIPANEGETIAVRSRLVRLSDEVATDWSPESKYGL